jgi:hypothetical protein
MSEGLSHDDLFRLFVLEHQQAVMVHLGKMVHPASGKIERNLEAARLSIDLLSMLEAKTRGNLEPDEERLLSQVLTTLRLNYVEEARRPAPEAPAEPPRRKPEGESKSEEAARSAASQGPAGPDAGTETPEAAEPDDGEPEGSSREEGQRQQSESGESHGG